MAMSRRFFKDLAQRYKLSKPPLDGPSRDVWRGMILDTCHAIELENPSFQRQRFLEACGWGDEPSVRGRG